MLVLAPTMSPCHILVPRLKQRLIATKDATTMLMPTPKTLTELFTTRTIRLKDTNFTKLNQSKSNLMKKVTTDLGP